MFVHRVMECRLLYLASRSATHGESAPCKNTFVGLEFQHLLGFLIQWYSPESMHCVLFEKESLAVQLLNFIGG
jgi:hypothetical protein